MESLNQKIKQLVQKGKEKGYLTYEELNDILPDDADISPEKIDDILMMLDELGIDLIDETGICRALSPSARLSAAVSDGSFCWVAVP